MGPPHPQSAAFTHLILFSEPETYVKARCIQREYLINSGDRTPAADIPLRVRSRKMTGVDFSVLCADFKTIIVGIFPKI